MKVILPLKHPMVQHAPKSSGLFGILQTHPDFNEALLQLFIHLEFNEDYSKINVEDFYLDRKLRIADFYTLTRQFVDALQPDPGLFLIQSIQSGHYPIIMIDMFYLNNYVFYQAYHREHPILVYGYDTDEKVFYVADFFDREYYSTGTETFENLLRAYNHIYETKQTSTLTGYDENLYYREVSTVNIITVNTEERFCCPTEQFRQNLVNYLDRSFPGGTAEYSYFGIENKNDYVFNQQCYGILHQYIDDSYTSNEMVFRRPFYLIKAHKSLMVHRIEYLINGNRLQNPAGPGLLKKFRELEQDCLTMLNIVIKMGFHTTANQIKSLHEFLARIEKQETYLLKTLIHIL